ncbi:amidohydrolase [Nakamurella sp.]|uniref:amidohydrolase n=1 Tax=Nakamurella sp. TaxID=1869182 RepID=UPI003782DE77
MSELRVVGATIVADPERELRDAEIAYSSDTGRVTYLGPVRGPVRSADLDGTGRLVLPGLVNAHTHAGMSLLRGHSDDEPLDRWLGHIRAFELRMTRDDIRAGLLLSMAEMIRSGTVAFADMYLWDAGLVGDVRDAGLRVLAATAVFGYDAVAYPAATPETGAQVLDRTSTLAAEFAGDELVQVSFGPHAPYTCGPELLADVARRATTHDLPVHIHLSETAGEVRDSLDRNGCSPIALAHRVGLDAGRLHVAHAVHPHDDADLAILARPTVSVAHCPVSNLKLGAGVAPVPEFQGSGVCAGLGTDSMASNNSADMFEEMKTAALVARGTRRDPTAVLAADVVRMATRGGARAFGDRLSGRLAVGEPADLIMLDVTAPHATPMPEPVAHLAYSARGSDVTDVVVAGRRLLAAGRLTTLDEAAIRADVRHRVARITAELGRALPSGRRPTRKVDRGATQG